MTDKTEACPFCATAIPPGASVCPPQCVALSAGLRRQPGRDGLADPVLSRMQAFATGGFWLFWGPLVGFMGLRNFGGNDPVAIEMCVLGIAVTVGGFFPLRWMCRKLVEPVWRRHVA